MVKVYVSKQSGYAVSTSKIKSALIEFFQKEGIVSDADVCVAFVGEEKMMELSRRYLKDSKLHNILSFPTTEVKSEFRYPPDEILHLGDIVICYPKILEEANDEGKLIDEKAVELAIHGALHLLGKHHD
jgi:probable rRNA maturation factor